MEIQSGLCHQKSMTYDSFHIISTWVSKFTHKIKHGQQFCEKNKKLKIYTLDFYLFQLINKNQLDINNISQMFLKNEH